MTESQAQHLQHAGTRHAQVVAGMNYELFWTANILCSPEDMQKSIKLHAQYYVPLHAAPMLRYVERLRPAEKTEG